MTVQSATTQIVTPGRMLRIESLIIMAAALALYAANEFSWFWFVALLLAPDLAMVGYLFGTRVGATVYNAAHTYSTPLAIGATDDKASDANDGTAAAATIIISSTTFWLFFFIIYRV